MEHHYKKCTLEPVAACIFFNSTCLANITGATEHVEAYMWHLEDSLTFLSLTWHFIDSLVIFTLARFGGVPIPHASTAGSFSWWVFMIIVLSQWLMVALSLAMDVLHFLALRAVTTPCLIKPVWTDAFAIFDVGGIVLLLAHPEVLTRLLMLFVSAYLLSTAYKVRLHSEKMLDEGVFGGSEDTGKESEQSLHSILQSQAKDEFDADAGAGVDHKLAEREKLLLVYKKDLPNELQPVRFCSLHYWMVHLFAVSWVINLPLASPALALIPAAIIFPGIAYVPVTVSFGALMMGIYLLMPIIEDATRDLGLKTKVRQGQYESQIRFLTGWFSDLGRTLPELFGTLGFPFKAPWHYATAADRSSDASQFKLSNGKVRWRPWKEDEAKEQEMVKVVHVGTANEEQTINAELYTELNDPAISKALSDALQQRRGQPIDVDARLTPGVKLRHIVRVKVGDTQWFCVPEHEDLPHSSFQEKDLHLNKLGSFYLAAKGDSDAGFLTLAYGLQVFVIALALAPITCYGVWLTIGFYAGTTTKDEAFEIVSISYRGGISALQQLPGWLGNLLLLDFELMMPQFQGLNMDEAFNMLMELIKLLITTPVPELIYQYLKDLYLTLLNLFLFDISMIDVGFFQEGAKALLLLNSIMSVLKIVLVNALNFGMVIMALLAYHNVATVPFGACVPSQEDLEKEKLKQDAHVHLHEKLEAYHNGTITKEEFKAFLNSVEMRLIKAEGDFKQAMKELHEGRKKSVKDEGEAPAGAGELEPAVKEPSWHEQVAKLWEWFSQGSVWKKVEEPPSGGMELHSPKLAEALEGSMQSFTRFTRREWVMFDIMRLRTGHYIKNTAGEYFVPVGLWGYPQAKIGMGLTAVLGICITILVLDQRLPPAPQYETPCELKPHVTCLFFEPQRLMADEQARKKVEEYMHELTGGLTLWNLVSLFLSNLFLLALATAGGVPVPRLTWAGTIAWVAYMFVQFLVWLAQALALAMDVFTFFALRSIASDYLVTFEWWGSTYKLLDVAFLSCFGLLPAFLSRLLSLFVYSYAFSIGLKVFWRAGAVGSESHQSPGLKWRDVGASKPPSGNEIKPGAPGSLELSEKIIAAREGEQKGAKAELTEEEFKEFGLRNIRLDTFILVEGKYYQPDFSDVWLRAQEQKFPLATLHYLVAAMCLFSTLFVSIVVGPLSIIVGIPYAPLAGVLALLMWATYKFGGSTLSGLEKRGYVFLHSTTFWFSDLSKFQPDLWQALRSPLHLIGDKESFLGCLLASFPGVQLLDPNRQAISAMWRAGQGTSDAGFLTLAFGFQVFWACLVLSPVLVLGLWLNIATFTGTMDVMERGNYIYAEWRQEIAGAAALLRLDFSFLLHIKFLGLDLSDLGELFATLLELYEAFTGGWKEAVLELLRPLIESWDEFPFLNLEMFDQLQEATKALVTLNMFFTLVKPLSVFLLFLWTTCAHALYKNTTAIVKFGDCVPDEATLEAGRRFGEMVNELMRELETLLRTSMGELHIEHATERLNEAEKLKVKVEAIGDMCRRLQQHIKDAEAHQTAEGLPAELMKKGDDYVKEFRDKEKLAAASLENAKLVQKAADKTSDGPPGSPGSPPGSPGSPGVGHQEKAKETVERKTLELSEAKKALERAEQVRKRAYALADDFGSEQIKLSHPELQRVMKEIRVAKKYQGDTKEAPPAPAPP